MFALLVESFPFFRTTVQGVWASDSSMDSSRGLLDVMLLVWWEVVLGVGGGGGWVV